MIHRLDRLLGEEPVERLTDSLAERVSDRPSEFRDSLTLASARGQCRYGDIVQMFQVERYADLDPALESLVMGEEPKVRWHWWEGTKGSSKDTDLALEVIWALAASDRKLRIQVCAADQEQAGELRDAAVGILLENPWLDRFVRMNRNEIVNPATLSRAKIEPADIRGSHGARPDVLIINELHAIQHEQFVKNMLFNAFKMSRCVVIIATNAGFKDTWQWNMRELARTSADWAFHKFDRPAPWLTESNLEQARQQTIAMPTMFRRLFYGEWCDVNEGHGIPSDQINAAFQSEHSPMTGAEPGFLFVAGLDIGIRRHRTGLCVLGIDMGHTVNEPIPEEERKKVPVWPGAKQPPKTRSVKRGGTGRVHLAYTKSWSPGDKGGVQFQKIQDALLEVASRYRCPVYYDPHEATHLTQNLAGKVRMVEVRFSGQSKTDMASEITQHFHRGNLVLYPDKELEHDIRAMRVVEKTYGTQIEQPEDESGHGDLGTAFMIALFGGRSVHVGGPTLMDLAKRI